MPTSSSCEAIRLCCGLSASHLSAFFTFCSICARGMPSTPLKRSASSFRLDACASARTCASLASIALRSRLVTSLRVFSSSVAMRAGFYQRKRAPDGAHRAVGDELLEVRGEGARRDAVDALRNVVVHERQHLFDGGPLETLERRHHLALAVQAVRDQPAQLLLRRADEVAVSRRDDRDVLAEKLLERPEV